MFKKILSTALVGLMVMAPVVSNGVVFAGNKDAAATAQGGVQGSIADAAKELVHILNVPIQIVASLLFSYFTYKFGINIGFAKGSTSAFDSVRATLAEENFILGFWEGQ